MKLIPVLLLVVFVANSYSQDKDMPDPAQSPTIFDIQKNALSLETNIVLNAINYGRLIPLSKHTSINVGAGISFGFGILTMSFESAILMGGTKHFCEIGIESYLGVKNDEINSLKAQGYRIVEESKKKTKVKDGE